VDVDELQHALGGIVLESAYLERVLRAAFSALVGSKYAAVVDGRRTASALIEDCERITRYHTGIPEPAKDALQSALRACHEANKERNRVIHDTWATRPGTGMVTLQGGRKSHDVTVTARTLAEVRQLADQVANAADELKAAMTTAIGSRWALVEDQLRQELGHDISANPGQLASVDSRLRHAPAAGLAPPCTRAHQRCRGRYGGTPMLMARSGSHLVQVAGKGRESQRRGAATAPG
jgi:hypothetical protein